MRSGIGVSWLAVLIGLLPAAAQAQGPRPEDVATIDGITRAVYEAISGPAGAPRDWTRFRPLFHPGARLIPTGRQNGVGAATSLTVEEFISRATPGMEGQGFFEREIGRVSERYGNIVHFMSAYESRRTAEDPAPFQRGVNSFQLFWDGSRWWIVTIFWEAETPNNPIPERLLRAP